MDIQLFYVTKGHGKPLVLLHGNQESSADFAAQIEAFSVYFQVIAIDTRGHGQSPRGKAPFTISQFADDLASFLVDQGIPKILLLGFSDGANIAMVFALRYPEMVDHLILNGGNLNGYGVKLQYQLPIVLRYYYLKLSQKNPREVEMLGLMVRDPALRPQTLRQIHQPVLVIAGTHDMIRRQHTKNIARHLTNAKLVFIEGDHFIAYRHPDAFNAAVLSFLGCHDERYSR